MKTPSLEFKNTFEPGVTEDAIAAMGDTARESKMFRVPLENVHPVADFNIRIHDESYEAHVNKIKQSIADNGFFNHRPLKVYVAKEGDQNLLYLCDGYTRFEATKRAVADGAKITRVPVVVVPKTTSMDDLILGLDADNDSRPLAPFEKGIIVKRLLALDNSEEEIATKLRITKNYVADLILMMSAPKTLHNMVVGGEVAAALAIDLIKEHGSGKKAVEALKAAGATGETPPPNGSAAPATRVTRSRVAKAGGTNQAGKKLYAALIEYLIVTGKTSGAQAAYDFLIRWNEKDPAAVKELAAIATPRSVKKKAKGKTKNPKDVRVKITDDMTDEQKANAREHNKNVKKRKERREARAALKAAEENEPV